MTTENLEQCADIEERSFDALYARHPEVNASIVDYDDYLYLEYLDVEDGKQGKGYGTAFMKDLCQFADSEELDIELSPSESEDDPEYYPKLVAFYQKFGFYVTSEKDRYMLRQSCSA